MYACKYECICMYVKYCFAQLINGAGQSWHVLRKCTHPYVGMSICTFGISICFSFGPLPPAIFSRQYRYQKTVSPAIFSRQYWYQKTLLHDIYTEKNTSLCCIGSSYTYMHMHVYTYIQMRTSSTASKDIPPDEYKGLRLSTACVSRSRSRSRSWSRTIYFSNISERKMNNRVYS